MKKAPSCNKELLADTKLATKETASVIKEVVSFYSEFIAATIREGAFESIMVPYFGKFEPKTKEIQYKADRKGQPKPNHCPVPLNDEDDDESESTTG